MSLLFMDPFQTGYTRSRDTASESRLRSFLERSRFEIVGSTVLYDGVTAVSGETGHWAYSKGAENTVSQGCTDFLFPAAVTSGKVVFGMSVQPNNSSDTRIVARFGVIGTIPSSNANLDNFLYLDVPGGTLTLNGVSSASGVVASPTSWNYYTIEYDLDNGTVDVYLNDDMVTPVLSATHSLTSIDRFSFVGYTAGTQTSQRYLYYKDFYALDSSGTSNNARLGVVRALRVPLAAVSGTPAFTPQGGAANNLAAVNKTNNSTTTYNQSPAANDVGDDFTLDTSALNDVPIHAVSVQRLAQKTDSTSRGLAVVIKEGAEEAQVPTVLATGSWGMAQVVFEELPDSGATITKAALAGVTVGYEVKAA